METRVDFQRLMEDMDKAIKRKQLELTELDERLESAREQLSEREAKELALGQDSAGGDGGNGELTNANNSLDRRTVEEFVQRQRAHYEQQIAQLNEELTELETINQELVKELDTARYERDLLRDTSERLKAKGLILNESLEEVKSANFELNMQLARAESESKMQQKLLKKSHEQDQVLMEAFNDKLAAMKEAIASRDGEIKQLRSDNQFALDSLGIKLDFNDSDDNRTKLDEAASPSGLVDSGNKHRVIEIASAFREKDAQIELLTGQLLQATRDLENNANLLEMLTKKQATRSGNSQELPSLGLEAYQELVARCQMLESELEAKDRQLHSNELRTRHYELTLPNRIIDLVEELKSSSGQLAVAGPNGEPSKCFDSEKVNNLADHLVELLAGLSSIQRLLDTIEQHKRINAAKDTQIGRLVRDLNELGAKLELGQPDLRQADQVDTREELKMVVDETERIESRADGQSDGLAGQSVQCKSKSGGGQEQSGQQVAADDGVLSAGSRSGHQPTGGGHPLEGSGPATGRNDADTDTHLGGPLAVAPEAGQSSSLASRTARPTRRLTVPHSSSKLATSTNTKPTSSPELDAQNRLRQLENENQLLELAMKEILLSIKWSDSRCSTILIDCPSLERLCQLIEARFLASSRERIDQLGTTSSGPPVGDHLDWAAGDMFQVVVMKSELDLLRGQNEQLRADLKMQRQEYQELLDSSRQPSLPEAPPVAIADSDDESPVEPASALVAQCEAECQTDSLIVLSSVETKTAPSNHDHFRLAGAAGSGCPNCSRLTRLANHLLECIVRIETRVNMSDESHMNRLVAMYQLSQRLGQDLSSREATISALNRKCHELIQRKQIIKTRLEMLESQTSVHSKICPLSRCHTTSTIKPSNGLPSLQVARPTAIGHDNESVHTLTVQSDQRRAEVPLRDSRMTISLLQSIIGCLQARLDYKDERMHQLEQLLSDRD